MHCLLVYCEQEQTLFRISLYKGGSTLVTLPRNVTPYRDSVNGARDRVALRTEQVWTCSVTLHVHTCSGRNHIIPLL